MNTYTIETTSQVGKRARRQIVTVKVPSEQFIIDNILFERVEDVKRFVVSFEEKI
jgi:hypothetical protein